MSHMSHKIKVENKLLSSEHVKGTRFLWVSSEPVSQWAGLYFQQMLADSLGDQKALWVESV